MKKVKKIAYVLKKSLRKKGEAGDVVQVARGFGRYLESQDIAQRANEGVLKSLEDSKKQWQKEEENHIKTAQALIDKIKGMEIIIKKRVSQGEKLYDSVRPENIVAEFAKHGFKLENHHIKLNTQIKKTGKHPVVIHAYGNLETEVIVEVISEDAVF